jgi:hypothetical protein
LSSLARSLWPSECKHCQCSSFSFADCSASLPEPPSRKGSTLQTAHTTQIQTSLQLAPQYVQAENKLVQNLQPKEVQPGNIGLQAGTPDVLEYRIRSSHLLPRYISTEIRHSLHNIRRCFSFRRAFPPRSLLVDVE